MSNTIYDVSFFHIAHILTEENSLYQLALTIHNSLPPDVSTNEFFAKMLHTANIAQKLSNVNLPLNSKIDGYPGCVFGPAQVNPNTGETSVIATYSMRTRLLIDRNESNAPLI